MIRRISALGCLVFCILIFSNIPVLAQTSAEGPWTTPVNLSQSGGAINPVMVEDSEGVIHVIWQDTIIPEDERTEPQSGYARYDGEVWTSPEKAAFPFSPYIPLLIADNDNRVHALWIDDEGILYSSRVSGTTFGDAWTWSRPDDISQSVLDVDAVVDEGGITHIVYLSSQEDENNPAGVYYRRKISGGIYWTKPETLYTTPYFQYLSAEDANVEIAYARSDEVDLLYTVWDNRSRKQVYLSRSSDRGTSWEPAELISGPDPGLSNRLPYDINVNAQNEDVLLLWQIGEPGSNCVQYYQYSTDRGVSWNESQQMLEDSAICPKGNYFFSSGTSPIVLMSLLFDKPYLLAWDGIQWSDPQLQDTLIGFEDPEVYTYMTLGCLHGSLIGEDQLLVVGCDSEDGGDIWTVSRSLEGNQAWFSPPELWSALIEIQTSSLIIETPSMLVDGEDRFHVIWTQVNETVGRIADQAMYYAHSEGNTWFEPVELFDSQSVNVQQPSLVLGRNNRIYLVWIGGESGDLNISWVDAGLTRHQGEWAPAQIIPVAYSGIGGYDFLEAIDGSLKIAFSLPFNEERGIYLTLSNYGQDTGSSVIQAFDGQSNGWAKVGSPQLAQTADGVLHLMWAHLPMPGERGPVSLHYSRSVDGGAIWSQDVQVSEASIISTWLVSSGEHVVHILLFEQGAESPKLNHLISYDSGLTWVEKETFSIFGNLKGFPGLTVDPSGQIHFFQVIQDFSGREELQHWQWNGELWILDSDLELPRDLVGEIDQVEAVVSATGSLGVILSGEILNPVEKKPEYHLTISSRAIELTENISGPHENTPEVLPTTPVSDTAQTTTPTAIPDQPAGQAMADSSGPVRPANRWTGVMLGGGLGLLFIVGALAIRHLVPRVLLQSLFVHRIKSLINRIKSRKKKEQ